MKKSSKRRIVLASASPRRKSIMAQILGENFEVIPSRYDESKTSKKLSPKDYALENAKRKGLDVAEDIKDGIVISADTIVVIDDEILEKPIDEEDARKMLRKISDKKVLVITGLYVKDTHNDKAYERIECGYVKIGDLTDKEINNYVKTKEPMDKSGSFGVQEKGAVFIEGIEGCYYNILGLPVFELNKILKDLGIDVFEY